MIGKSEQPLADNPLFRPGEEIETTITAIETAQDIPGPFKPVHDSILLQAYRIFSGLANLQQPLIV